MLYCLPWQEPRAIDLNQVGNSFDLGTKLRDEDQAKRKLSGRLDSPELQRVELLSRLFAWKNNENSTRRSISELPDGNTRLEESIASSDTGQFKRG